MSLPPCGLDEIVAAYDVGELKSVEPIATGGALLAELHSRLAEIQPRVGKALRVCTKDAADAIAQIDSYLALIDRRPTRDDFDERARECLTVQQEMLAANQDRRPFQSVRVEPAGWIHGDFHQFNLLWEGNQVTAILDWDRLRVDWLLAELVRASNLIFMRPDGRGIDLERLSAFGTGYRATRPVRRNHLSLAVDHWWWDDLCGLWPLTRHHDRGDTTCDHFVFSSDTRRRGWADHDRDVRTAFLD